MSVGGSLSLRRPGFLAAFAAIALLLPLMAGAQPAASGAQAAAPAPNPFLAPRFPVHPPAPPQEVAAGKALFSANCSFCHGSNARGGESGPNLLRSETVLNDQNGERIAQVVQNGRIDEGMPRFSLDRQQIGQIAAFLHSFPLVTRDAAANVNPVVGNAQAGQAFFTGAGHCAGCHSANGDLAGIGNRFHPRELQRAMLTANWQGSGFSSVPNMIPPGTTATVTTRSGQSYQGRLQSIDEFSVTLLDPAGAEHSFERNGGEPRVQIHNPLAQHLALWRVLTDEQIHNLTAYLVTLK